MPNLHRVVVAEEDVLPEHFDAVLEVSRCEQDVCADHLMLTLRHVLLHEGFPGLPDGLAALSHIHRHMLPAILVHLVMDHQSHFLQDGGEILAPPESVNYRFNFNLS